MWWGEIQPTKERDNDRERENYHPGCALFPGRGTVFGCRRLVGLSPYRDYFGSHWLNEQRNDIRSKMVMLGYLRSGETAKAAEMLEELMYDDLIALEPDRFILRRTKDNINQTRSEVRAFRAKNPYTRRSMIDRMIERTLFHPPY